MLLRTVEGDRANNLLGTVIRREPLGVRIFTMIITLSIKVSFYRTAKGYIRARMCLFNYFSVNYEMAVGILSRFNQQYCVCFLSGYEPLHGKTNNLHGRKQRRRSASQ